jgi:hypothetical protein
VTPAGSPIFAEQSASVKFHSDLQPARITRYCRRPRSACSRRPTWTSASRPPASRP